MTSMILRVINQGLCPVPTYNGNSLSPVMVGGGFCSLQYDICDRFSASATYSQFRTYAHKYKEGSNPWNEQYKYGQYVSTNIFYEASSFFEIGFEYIWGRRVNYDGMKCADNRVQFSFQLSF